MQNIRIDKTGNRECFPLWLSPKLKTQLKKLAAEKHISMTDLIRGLIEKEVSIGIDK
jgi:hypothetical protein